MWCTFRLVEAWTSFRHVLLLLWSRDTSLSLQGAQRYSWRPIPAHLLDTQTSMTLLYWFFTPWDSWSLDSWSQWQPKVPEGNPVFKETKDAVDDLFQHTQWTSKHQSTIFQDFMPLGIGGNLIHDLSSNQSCQRGIRPTRRPKMRLTTHSSIPSGETNSNPLPLVVLHLLA